MTGKVETSLKKLSLLSKSLNEASDELSKQISAIESELNEFKLGTWAWVRQPILTETDLSDPDNQGKRYEYTFEYQLGYGKVKGKWGLVVSYGWEGDDGTGTQVTFLRDASREVRIKAMDKLPELLEVLSQEVSALTKETSQKASDAKQIAVALNDSKNPR